MIKLSSMKKQLVGFSMLLAVMACNNPATKSVTPDGFITAKGMFYCEGMVAADGLGCMIKIDGTVYKMQNENAVLYEESAAFDKAGKPVPMTVVYKKTGQYHKLMNGSNGPELITIRSITPSDKVE